MMRVALSGGIASGKTTVSNAIAEYGVPIIDTDILAREVVEPGTDGLRQIVDRFGDSILDEHGALDRRQLRGIVFSDDSARAYLESVLHPLIRDLTTERLEQLDQETIPYAVIVIPLLVETGQENSYDRVIIVDVEPKIQIQRVMQRDNCTEEEAERILASQATREQRLAVADDVIFNSASTAAVDLQVKKLHEHLLRVAKKKAKQSNS